jgi:hypothetical protein
MENSQRNMETKQTANEEEATFKITGNPPHPG